MIGDLHTITFITGQLGLGGAEKQLYLLTEGLLREKWEVSVITFSPDTNNYYQEPLRDLGAEIVKIPQNASRYQRISMISSFLAQKKPQIVHSWGMFTNLYAAVGGRLAGVPIRLGSERANENLSILSMGKVLYNISLLGLNGLVTNSKTAQNMLSQSHSGLRVFVVPNGIKITQSELILKHESRNLLGIPENVLVLGGVGTLEGRKNFKCLIEASSELHKRGFNHFLVIVGDGPLLRDLSQKAANLLPKGSYKFTGPIPNASRIYSAFDIFCFTSKALEGMPNVVMEASAAGIPIVANAVDEVHNLIHHGVTGYIIEPDDEIGRISYISDLLINHDLRDKMGKAALKKISEEYSFDDMVSNMANIYQNFL